MPDLIPCPTCHDLIAVGTCECPHCGRTGICRSSPRLSRAAVLMGLAISSTPACFFTHDAYGVAMTETDEDYHADDDGDGYSEADGDCNDDNEDIHPEAEETPGDEVDSNCNGDDDT